MDLQLDTNIPTDFQYRFLEDLIKAKRSMEQQGQTPVHILISPDIAEKLQLTEVFGCPIVVSPHLPINSAYLQASSFITKDLT